jgi:hypothetical protein
VTTGFNHSTIHVWAGAKQALFDIFAIIWQAKTYRTLFYLFLAVPLGLIYSLVLIFGLLFPIILLYLATIRSGPLSPLFLTCLVIGFLVWRLMPRFVKIAIQMEKSLAEQLIGRFRTRLTEPKSESTGSRRTNLSGSVPKNSLKELLYLSFRIPMGFANLILLVIALLIPLLMLLAPWIYAMTGPGIIFSSASVDNSAEAILLMFLALPMFIVVLSGLRTLAIIQGRFAILMLTDDSI